MSDGCRCSSCFGLAEYMLNLTGTDHQLPHAPGHEIVRLRVLTGDPQRSDSLIEYATSCDGSMTCPCDTCAADRAARVRHGVREVAQPWQPSSRAA